MAKNPKGREPLILKESQKEVDPLFSRKKGKNGNFGWKEQKECDKSVVVEIPMRN